MKKLFLSVVIVSLSVFVGGALAFGQSAGQSSTPQAATSTTEHHVHHVVHHHVHHVVHHAAAASGVNYTAKYAHGIQTLSGTLTMADTGQKILVVKDSDGTPFNFNVTNRTRIDVGGQKSSLDSLSDQTNKQVEVKYRDALNRGLIATSVNVSD